MLIKNWKQFAKATIETHDLDPTYDFLYHAKNRLGEEWAIRFALNYLCFYDMGGAVAAAEQTTGANFWEYMLDNYVSFPRGTERRHSRGVLGLQYIQNLSARGHPYQLWRTMHAPTYTGLVKVFKEQFPRCGFGPYFVWKVMDFQDRCFGNPVGLNLDEAVKHCPDEPRKCAAILWPWMSFPRVMSMVVEYISQFEAPGKPGASCSYAEAETILCMLKGWGITKTHVIGDDIDTKHQQLAKWPDFRNFLPAQIDRSLYERPATLDATSLSISSPSVAS
jgi:hypothetical protein